MLVSKIPKFTDHWLSDSCNYSAEGVPFSNNIKTKNITEYKTTTDINGNLNQCLRKLGLLWYVYVHNKARVNPLSACKNASENVVCYIYLQILLTNVIKEENSVDPDWTAPI